jgi:hypothetical protein
MGELQFYDAAKAALSKAVKVDEVKQIHDKAAAYKAAAKIAKDKTLEADAAEIRMRAERRLGELMDQQKKTVGLNKGGGDKRSKHRDSKKPGDAKPTLAEAGIGKNLAQRARTAAKPSDQEFEQKVAADKEQIKSPPLKVVSKGKSASKSKTAKPTGPITQPTPLANFKYATDHWLPMLNADDLKKARAHFQDRADACEKEIAARPTGSAEISVEERRAANGKLAEEQKESASCAQRPA